MQYYIDIDIASIPYFLFLYLLACICLFVCFAWWCVCVRKWNFPAKAIQYFGSFLLLGNGLLVLAHYTKNFYYD